MPSKNNKMEWSTASFPGMTIARHANKKGPKGCFPILKEQQIVGIIWDATCGNDGNMIINTIVISTPSKCFFFDLMLLDSKAMGKLKEFLDDPSRIKIVLSLVEMQNLQLVNVFDLVECFNIATSNPNQTLSLISMCRSFQPDFERVILEDGPIEPTQLSSRPIGEAELKWAKDQMKMYFFLFFRICGGMKISLKGDNSRLGELFVSNPQNLKDKGLLINPDIESLIPREDYEAFAGPDSIHPNPNEEENTANQEVLIPEKLADFFQKITLGEEPKPRIVPTPTSSLASNIDDLYSDISESSMIEAGSKNSDFTNQPDLKEEMMRLSNAESGDFVFAGKKFFKYPKDELLRLRYVENKNPPVLNDEGCKINGVGILDGPPVKKKNVKSQKEPKKQGIRSWMGQLIVPPPPPQRNIPPKVLNYGVEFHKAVCDEAMRKEAKQLNIIYSSETLPQSVASIASHSSNNQNLQNGLFNYDTFINNLGSAFPGLEKRKEEGMKPYTEVCDLEISDRNALTELAFLKTFDFEKNILSSEGKKIKSSIEQISKWMVEEIASKRRNSVCSSTSSNLCQASAECGSQTLLTGNVFGANLFHSGSDTPKPMDIQGIACSSNTVLNDTGKRSSKRKNIALNNLLGKK